MVSWVVRKEQPGCCNALASTVVGWQLASDEEQESRIASKKGEGSAPSFRASFLGGCLFSVTQIVLSFSSLDMSLLGHMPLLSG